MNKRRIVLEHRVSKERRSLLQPVSFNRMWQAVETEVIPVHRDRGNAPPLVEDPELGDLALSYGLSVPDMLDRAREKFGSNITVKALMLQIKVRGL